MPPVSENHITIQDDAISHTLTTIANYLKKGFSSSHLEIRCKNTLFIQLNILTRAIEFKSLF